MCVPSPILEKKKKRELRILAQQSSDLWWCHREIPDTDDVPICKEFKPITVGHNIHRHSHTAYLL
jgi:hypothetical protein